MAVAPAKDIDPFTVEILKDSLIAIGDEMFVALQRTSMRTIIYEVLDFASGLTDARGQLITQGNGVTGFLGTLTFAVRETLQKFGADGLAPGDVIVTNDPYSGGGTHLSDVSLVVPIFYDGELVNLVLFEDPEGFDGQAVGHVRGDDEGAAAGVADLVRERLQRLAAAGGEDDVGAAAGELVGGGAADAGGGAGDDGGAALDIHLRVRGSVQRATGRRWARGGPRRCARPPG
jgi:hypothetical protein